jgi:hypothetical protein
VAAAAWLEYQVLDSLLVPTQLLPAGTTQHISRHNSTCVKKIADTADGKDIAINAAASTD